MTRNWKTLLVTAMAGLAVSLLPVSCSDGAPRGQAEASKSAEKTALARVSDYEHFRNIVQEAGERLIVFEFYADWCRPCRLLEPILEDLAGEFGKRIAVFKVDIDANRDLAVDVGVRGVPYVLFVRNGKSVHSLMGLHPKETYRRAVDEFVQREDRSALPDGTLVNGVRLVRRSTAAPLDSIYVYRGETVQLRIEEVDFPYAISIPKFDISEEATVGRPLEVTFTARELGVFPVFCNGDCPTGDGQQFGTIVVMQLEGDEQGSYREISAVEALRWSQEASPLVLDVRTPREFYQGHLPGARLIPLQQLQERLREIEDYKDQDILIYCRSGNRSTVAAKILMDAGFGRLHNLRHGILEWEKENLPVVR